MKTFFPIPPDDMPDETVCFVLRVPNSPQWISALWWVLDQYSYWFNWQRTDDKRGALVALRWREMFWTAVQENKDYAACPDDICEDTGITLGELMSTQIRLKPDDPCVIQMWCIDGWQDWYDPRGCLPGSLEQPTDGEGIEPGECREWNVSLSGSEKWLLPAVVSEGDLIEITGASGAWNDGTLGWNCVNGFTFGFGACVSADLAEPGDPVATLNHMRLIANVGGVWYDAYNQIIAVAAGVTDENVYFQANDSDLTDNSGTVSFKVKLCRAAVVPSTITISYDYGSGVTTLTPTTNDEWIINVDSELDPYGQAVRMTFSEPIKLTVLQCIGYVLHSPTPGGEHSREQLSGSPVEILTYPTSTTPLDHTPGNTCDNIQSDTGGGGAAAAWVMQLKIERV